MDRQCIVRRILGELNPVQLEAVTSPATGQLQVIAGPGTGKTKVLTSRVAYLLLHSGIDPANIFVTTFTKKAANEMKERLRLMMRDSDINLDDLLIGTFHSICVRILRKFGHHISLRNLKIANERDSGGILKKILNDMEGELVSLLENSTEHETRLAFNSGPQKNKTFDPKTVSSYISKLKSKGVSAEKYSSDHTHNKPLLRIYQAYTDKLREFNFYDFDDLLLFTLKLFREKACLTSIEHIFIDEFQDTNTIQIELMICMAKQNPTTRDNITIVGDPDQSIYSFRDAVSENFKLMCDKYPKCSIISLDENYRSTNNILQFSEQLLRQENGRSPRSLKSQSSISFDPVYFHTISSDNEADAIAQEIKQLIKLPKMYNYSDFVILIRAAFLSRTIEKGFIKHRIPYHIVKGRAFWERKEVSLLVDFLRLFAYDDDILAIVRVVSECTPGLGSKSIDSLTVFLEEKLSEGVLPLDALSGLIAGKYKSKTTIRGGGNIAKFMTDIDNLYKIYNQNNEDKSVILEMFDKIKSLDVFKEIIKKNDEAAANIAEVRNHIYEFFDEGDTSFDHYQDTNELSIYQSSFLDKFINSVDLYIVADSKDETIKGRVRISTIHAAKGLEWSVVFVPSLIQGILPSSKSDNSKALNEERRVFYVATTRAKHLLYLSYGPRGPSELSAFITQDIRQKTVTEQIAFRDVEQLKKLYQLHNVPVPPPNDLHAIVSSYQNMSKDRRISNNQSPNGAARYSMGMGGVITTNINKMAGFEKNASFVCSSSSRSRVSESVIQQRDFSKAPAPNFAPKAEAVIARDVPMASRNSRLKFNSPKMGTANNSTEEPVKKKKTLGVRRRF